MFAEYIEQRNGGFYIRDTRVSLDSVVYAFLRRESPEGISESFPVLRLDRIFGALAYYTANRDAVDRYLAQDRIEFEAFRQENHRLYPALYAKLRKSQAPLC